MVGPEISGVLVWSIAFATIAAILFRPRDWPEAVWACAGALALVSFRLLSPGVAWQAIGKGADVYLFLTGMMLLAELARAEGVFDWLAGLAVRASGDAASRLFLLVYAAGTLVTIFLSNDATAVVFTPAVYAAVRKARTPAMPHLLCCAFIANAASFVLPISNPANLVVYGAKIPHIEAWLRLFLLPSLVSVTVTFAVLRYLSRSELSGRLQTHAETAALTHEGRRAAWGIVATGVAVITASAVGADLGWPTCVAAAATVVMTTRARSRDLADVARAVSWSVLPLVAGLFVLVEALNQYGALRLLTAAIQYCGQLPPLAGSLAASVGIAALSNVLNNLPSGLLVRGALESARFPDAIRHALLIGVDLGPNLSVSGSLATILWLIALRREGVRISPWTFLKAGIWVMPAALILSVAALVLTL